MKRLKYNSRDIISIFIAVCLLSTLPLFVIVFLIETLSDENAASEQLVDIKAKSAGGTNGLDALQENENGSVKAESSFYNSAARFIAGMNQEEDNRLKKLQSLKAWRNYADNVDKKWAGISSGKLSKIANFSEKELDFLDDKCKTIFYPFSGPDFLHVFKFFPNADRYILAALEKTGSIPGMAILRNDSLLYRYILRLNHSMRDILNLSFFKTKNMDSDLKNQEIDGVLPVMLFFLARTGNRVIMISPITLTEEGDIAEEEGYYLKFNSGAFKLIFLTEENKKKEILYFSKNIDDSHLKKDKPFKKFIEKNSYFITYIKAASYLMHNNYFSAIRNIILKNSLALLQDDSGIPLRFFKDGGWQLKFYGSYTGPISLFADKFQKDLKDYYDSHKPKTLDFGLGYKFHKGASNLMLAIKR